MSLQSKLAALADAIRTKTGRTAKLSIDAMSAAISSIETAAASKQIIKKLIERNSLTEFSIPDGLTRIGAYAFAGCASLTLPSIPNGISVIDDWAFSGCTGITNMCLPKSIVSIGEHAFYGCTEISDFKVDYGYDANLPLGSCKLLSVDCIRGIIENFADNGSTGVTRTLNLNPDVYALLSRDVMQSASQKGITITG